MSEAIITFMASFLIWLLFVGLMLLWLIDGRIKKEVALHALISSTFAWVLAEMIKNLFPTLRPFQTNGISPLTLTVPFGASFPSAHTAASFGLATSVWLHDRKVGTAFLLAAFGVGLGRVLGNVHSPIDVFVGGLLGFATGLLVEKLHVGRLILKRKS